MRKQFLATYLLILLVILVVMSFSRSTIERWRSAAITLIAPLKNTPSPAPLMNEEIRRLQLENQLLQRELAHRLEEKGEGINQQGVAAKVIFRAIDSWHSALWINKGMADNNASSIIAKNSPIVVGRSIVGLIDYVGKHQSRVRLITDSELTPSVRATRNEGSHYLAKGELKGGGGPLWRRRSQTLLGTGFNYDFSDDKGEARDLRTGQGLGKTQNPMPIIKVNDILVTTGMDGVFPEGWQVATVTKIELLKEGDYCYELEATPTAGDLHSLTTVFIISPLGYDPEDRPR